MSYSSSGRKPAEYASKAAHQYLVNDPAIRKVIANLVRPAGDSRQKVKSRAIPFHPVKTSITDIFAIDGGYSDAELTEGFPGSRITFFQFGALHFSLDALLSIERSIHPNPEDMQRLKTIERIKFVLPTFNTNSVDYPSLTDSVRQILQEFLQNETMGEKESLLDTLAWFIFRKYMPVDDGENRKYYLSSLPESTGLDTGVYLDAQLMTSDYKFQLPGAQKEALLIDVFRLHEVINDNTGASGICGYVAGAVEHLILLHIIRSMLRFSGCLNRALLLLDRPTGFFGNTSRLVEPMKDLVRCLLKKENILMVGLEKSGAFVEHAHAIRDILPASSFIILDNDYIYNHISPPQKDSGKPYASTSYYGHKVIFKTSHNNMYVLSMPVPELKVSPKAEDIPNLYEILTHMEQLKCDMYENALLPIALANRLVSLSNIPSSQILEHFAKSAIRVCSH